MLCILAKATSGSIYNIGSGNEISLKNLANIISAKLFHKPKIEIKEYSILQNNFHWVADTSKVQKELGLIQKINIDDATDRTIEFYTTFGSNNSNL